jgi:YVTN family beta-propeller protein
MKKILIALTLALFVTQVFPSKSIPGKTEKDNQGIIVVANKSGDNIYLIDRISGKTIKKLPTGLQPHEVEVSSNGKYAVVTNYGDKNKPGNTLSVYNLGKAELIKTIDLGKNTRPHGMDWLSGTQKLLVTTEGSNSLVVVNIQKGTIEQKLNTHQEISHMVAASPNGKFAFVSSIRTGNVTVFNLQTGKLIKQLYSGEGAEGIAVTHNGKELWVTNRGENTIAVFNTQKLELIKKIKCGDFPIRAKFSPNGKKFVVSNARSGEIAVIDAQKKELIKKIKLTPPVPEDKDPERYFSEFEGTSVPIGLVVPDNKTAYVANTRSDAVTVFDLENLKIINHIPAGKEPDGINYSQVSPEK